MKKSLVVPSIFLAIVLLPVLHCIAQTKPDTTYKFRIETVNGNEYSGIVTATDSVRVYMNESKLGKISILKQEIRHFDRIDTTNMKEGAYWFENPQSTRYFWAPNGFGLKKGEGYYQNVWVLYNQASVGISDYFSIGAGLIPLFFFAGTETPAWIIPKISIPVVRDKFNLGAGVIAGTILGEDNAGFGIVYGVSTFGNRNNNVNLGLGYGYAGGHWAKRPLINLGAMARTGSKGYLITDNYFIGTGDNLVSIISIGGRSIIRRSAAIDYGLIIPLSSEMDGLVGIPWLGITVPFGSRNRPEALPEGKY
ncbi:MAG: Uncharacterized protein FD166_3264 [Bacteroidetes bacterium]|nr:MAG: Uncharacterized protein FD166_3264 [Bacteroidota bacterium]